jgi:hypothetical protein
MTTETIYPTGLSDREIRLLNILPFRFAPESLVACEFREYNIDACPTYEALSYYWGDSSEQRTVLCNDQTHSITTSLYQARSRLRQKDKTRLIWADALCIKQSNDHEKSIQVSRMGQIYSRAGRVVIWFGYPEDKSVRRIKEVFDGLHEDFGDDTSTDEDYWCTKDRSPPWDILEMFTNNV